MVYDFGTDCWLFCRSSYISNCTVGMRIICEMSVARKTEMV